MSRGYRAMLEGKIRRLDLAERTVVVATNDGREVVAKVPEGVLIEISEPETMGTMGGELEDLEVGYLVEMDVRDHEAPGACTCTSLVCVS